MTAQIPDKFYYRDRKFSIIDQRGDRYLEPDFVSLSEFRVEWSTACWRGYVAEYTLDEERRLRLCKSTSKDEEVDIQYSLPGCELLDANDLWGNDLKKYDWFEADDEQKFEDKESSLFSWFTAFSATVGQNEDKDSCERQKFGNGEILRLLGRVDFTGSLILGDDFDFGYYVHMGFQNPIGFNSLWRLDFVKGVLEKETDYSAEAARARKRGVWSLKIFDDEEGDSRS